MIQTQIQTQAEVQKDEYKYGVSILSNKIYMYHKICYTRDYCRIWGSVLRMDENTLEKYEVDTAAREDYKRLGVIVISNDEVQQIKAYAEQMLKLYGEGKYDDMVTLYSSTVKYMDNIINKYVTMLRDAYNNLHDAILRLESKRKNEKKEQYNLNIQAIPRMVEMRVYNYRYGVTVYTSSIYIWRAEYLTTGYDFHIRDEIQIELDTGIVRVVRVSNTRFGASYEYKALAWLRENEVMVLKDYAEHLADYMEQYDYNAVADVMNKAAQYVRGLIT